MINKQTKRTRRSAKTRALIKRLDEMRLTVHRTSNNIYAQVVAPDGAVKAAASTLDKTLREKLKHRGNKDAAKAVGEMIAERAIKAGVKKVAFDRSGFQYHGRIQVLAEAAREGGLDF